METFQWKLSLGAIPKTGTVFRIKNEESSRDDKTRQFYWRLGRTRHAARGLCALIKEAVNPGWFFAVLTLMVPPKRSLRYARQDRSSVAALAIYPVVFFAVAYTRLMRMDIR